MMDRRAFIGGLLAASGGAIDPRPAAAQAPPETARIRISYGRRGMCVAPQYVAEELLRNEGFAEVEYVRNKEGIVTVTNALAAGEIDMLMTFVAPLIIRVDGGTPIAHRHARRWPRGLFPAVRDRSRPLDP